MHCEPPDVTFIKINKFVIGFKLDRILKDIQDLKCEGKSLVLKTEESATKPKELIVEFLTGKI